MNALWQFTNELLSRNLVEAKHAAGQSGFFFARALFFPVVSTDVGEISFVLDEGDSGVLVKDPASELVDAIELVLNETEATHRKTEQAFHKVSGELSARSMAEQYLRVYNGVVAS